MHPAARIGFLYLLASAWQTDDCTVSADPLDLATESGLGDEMWAQYGGRILRKFRFEGGRYRNEVLSAEWSDAKEVYDKRRAGAVRTNSVRSADGERTQSERNTDTQTLTGTVTTTGTKKELKPSRDKRESDQRHVPFREEIETYALAKNVEFVWDPSEAKQLSLLLKACPLLTLEVFKQCLRHRARSPGVPHGQRPRVWLPNILSYQGAPLNEFGKTGGTNGSRNSKTGGNLDAARGALAILEQAERDSGDVDEVQPETGGRGEHGNLGHLRSGSIEL